MSREDQIQVFLDKAGFGDAAWRPLADDASFRRYFRVEADPPLVLMDAPPGKEDIVPFMAVGAFLNDIGLSAPRILSADRKTGFLLLEDLGDDTFTRLLARGGGPGEKALYAAAVDVLVVLHAADVSPALPVAGGGDYPVPAYDLDRMVQMASLFTDWHLPARHGEPTPDDMTCEFQELWREVLPLTRAGAPVLALYDYHADNLMWLPDREGPARVGLLDFQDAYLASAALDLTSLLKDCRRDVSEALEEAMVARYLAARPDLDPEAFAAAYAVSGAQRNTRILGVFTRLWKRDNKPRYLQIIPKVWSLLERDLEYPALAGLKDWFDRHAPSEMRAEPFPGAPEPAA